jgi:predicted RNA-binding protein with PUA-like domain
MAIWLFKTEPSEFPFARLGATAAGTMWDGVANPTALIHLRTCAVGDHVYIYHTANEKAIVGLAVVTKAAYPDPARPELNDRAEPRFAVVNLRRLQDARTPLTLASIKADPRFAEFDLLRQSRLSVMPVPAALARIIDTLTGLNR